MRVIIDNNLWISFVIGKKLQLLNMLFSNDKIEIFVCDELIDEFINVSSREKIRKYINFEDVENTLRIFHEWCTYTKIKTQASSPIRDIKDLYLLSLAETISADYIITGDKDLLVLSAHGNTKIITFNQFIAQFLS